MATKKKAAPKRAAKQPTKKARVFTAADYHARAHKLQRGGGDPDEVRKLKHIAHRIERAEQGKAA